MISLKQRRLKVLHVGKFYPPHMGGIETHLQTLCTELRAIIDLQVIVASDSHVAAEEVADGVPVSRIPTRLTFASSPLCPEMVRRIANSNADIIHLHLPNPPAVLAYLASRHRGRLVVTYHSDTVRQRFLGALFTPCLHFALKRAAAIIATSPNYRDTSPILSRYLDRCHIIPYGIPVQKFGQCDSAAVRQIRNCYGERLIVSVGRLVYYKGFEYLIQAMREVRGKLLIIGDGPLRGTLQEKVALLGLKQNVIFLGGIQNEQLIPYYHAADIFALASIARSEAFGIVQIEAMAARLPVVNTNLDSGVPFVSLHQQTGLTVRPRDSLALAASLNLLLDNHELRCRYGEAAQIRANREFCSKEMASRTLHLYHLVRPAFRSNSGVSGVSRKSKDQLSLREGQLDEK